MFKRVHQVQAVDVNEWVDRLMSAHDDVRAVEKIRQKLDSIHADAIASRERGLAEPKLYDWQYEGMPVSGSFETFIMELIDYQMPDDLVDKWQSICEQYQRIKAERANKDAAPVD